jgi:hypothetical protein
VAVSFVAAGATAPGGSGDVTPAMYTGVAVDDIIVVVVTAADNVVCSFPAAYTVKVGLTNGTTLKTTVAWKRATSTSEAAPLVTHTAGDTITARCLGYRGANGAGGTSDPFDTAITSANASSTTDTIAAITPSVANCMLICVISGGGIGTSNPNSFTAPTGTNPTFGADWTPSDQNGSGINEADMQVFHGIKTDTTSSGSRTSTLGVAAAVNSSVLLALQPPGGGAAAPAQLVRLVHG